MSGPPVHSFPNGTVSVKMHKRKRLTLVVDREDLNGVLIERLEHLEHENRVLRRKLSEALALSPQGTPEGGKPHP